MCLGSLSSREWVELVPGLAEHLVLLKARIFLRCGRGILCQPSWAAGPGHWRCADEGVLCRCAVCTTIRLDRLRRMSLGAIELRAELADARL